MSQTPITILLLAYPTFNTLDLNGPLEVLRNSALTSAPFTATIAAADEFTTAAEDVIVKRHISFSEALNQLEDFDILIQPGGPPDFIKQHLKPRDETFVPQLQVIDKFAQLDPSPRIGKRIIMSVCTGAFFLGYAGVFSGIKATTHFMALQTLEDICNAYNSRFPDSKPTTIIPDPSEIVPDYKVPVPSARYVKVQENSTGMVRVVSSGGISCGLDASLYLVDLLRGKDLAEKTAWTMEYAWRKAA